MVQLLVVIILVTTAALEVLDILEEVKDSGSFR